MINDKKFLKNRESIKPITFINDNEKITDELNNLFTLPYDLSIMSAVSTAAGLNSLNGTVPENMFNKFANDINNITTDNIRISIKSYLIMNCRDYIFTFLNTVLKNIFDVDSKFKIDNEANKYSEYNNENFYTSEYFDLSFNDINNFCNDYIYNLWLPVSDKYKMLNMYYYQLMNNFYFNLVIFIDEIIVNRVLSIYVRNLNKTKFLNLVSKVYGSSENINIESISAEYMYTFCTSIIREMLEKELPRLYSGIDIIFTNASKMAYLKDLPNREIGNDEIKNIN